MKFCSKCGSKVEIEQKFCSKCGFDLSNEESKNHFVSETKGNKSKDKLKLHSGSKNVIISTVIIMVLFVGCFIIGNNLSKPSKTISKFEKAVNLDDKKALSKILYSKDSKLEMSEGNAEFLLNYFKEDPLFLHQLIKDLNEDSLKFESFRKGNEINPKNDARAIRLGYVGKRFLVFPKYKIIVRPAFIEVKTELKDVEFSLNSVKVGKSDKDNYSIELGPFMPGKYELLASYKGSYVDLENTYNVDFIKRDNGKTSIKALGNSKNIRVTSEYEHADIFVNNKETGVKVKDAVSFGPVSPDTSLYAVVTLDGKRVKSEEVKFHEGVSNVHLSFRNPKPF